MGAVAGSRDQIAEDEVSGVVVAYGARRGDAFR